VGAESATGRWSGAVVLLLLVGLGLRGWGLNGQMWHDEIATVLTTIRVPLETLCTTYGGENQHTLYSVLAQGATTAFGERPWALRLPALIFGVLAIAALYGLGVTVATRPQAFAAAALLAVSYHPVWLSQNARGYTGLLLATIVATWCFIVGVRRPRWLIWVAYAIAVALGMYLHLTMVFVPISHVLVLALGAGVAMQRQEPLSVFVRPLLGLVLAAALTLALYAPMLDDLVAHFLRSKPSAPSEWKDLGWAVREMLRGLQTGFGLIGFATGAVLTLIGSWDYLRKSPIVLGLLILPGVIGIAIVVLLQHNIWPRFLFSSAGFGLLILMRGAAVTAEWMSASIIPSWLPDWRARLSTAFFMAASGAMLLASAYSLPRLYAHPKQDYLGALEFVEASQQPTEPVLTVGMAAYSYREFYQVDWTVVEKPEELQAVLAKNASTWLVYSFPVHLRSRHPQLMECIDSQFEVVKNFSASINGGQVYVARSRPRPVLVNSAPAPYK
jgi:4-amino-4-deoxy-L-arabinose transferase-like glycosyltransferase